MKKQLINYMRSGAPGIVIVSTEIKRAVNLLREACVDSKRKLFYWSFSTGMTLIEEKEASKVEEVPPADPAAMMKYMIEKVSQRATLVIQDAHIMFSGDRDISLVDTVRNLLSHCKKSKKTIVFLGCEYKLPPELAKEFQIIEMDLPSKEELITISSTMGGPAFDPEEADMIADSGTGMTEMEFENAVALSMVESKKVDYKIIQREKGQMLKKSGVLELVDASENMSSIGGLGKLKSWLISRSFAFGEKARDYGLPMPKGILIVGVPGTGKSLTAKATASILKRPLLKLDVSKVFAGIVGQSEGNMREAQRMAEAMAPCVLMIDEVGFSAS